MTRPVRRRLQAIPRGQTTTDTFTYRVNDGHGGDRDGDA